MVSQTQLSRAGDGFGVLVHGYASHQLEQLTTRPDAQPASWCWLHQHDGAVRRAMVHVGCLSVDDLCPEYLQLPGFLMIPVSEFFLKIILPILQYLGIYNTVYLYEGCRGDTCYYYHVTIFIY